MKKIFVKPLLLIAVGGAFLGWCAVCLRAAETDRVLAAVNGKIITDSDLKVAVDLNSLLVFGKSTGGVTLSKSEELSRLVDLELIRQELENFPIGSEDQANMESQIEELKQGYAEIGGLDTIMRRLGLREDELQSYIRLQASIMRFVNLRFRPFVEVTPVEIESYYNGDLLPPFKKDGAAVPALAEVSGKIERILAEQKVNLALDRWIKELRGHSRIEFFPHEGASAVGDQAVPGIVTPGSGTPSPSTPPAPLEDPPSFRRSAR